MLTNYNIRKIHEYSMKIIEKTGMKFHHRDAVEVLKSHGIRMEGNVAHFTEEQLMYWVRKAPHSFTLYGRNPEHTMVIGGDVVNCAPAYGSPLIVKQDGTRYSAKMEDYIKFTKLYHNNDNFHVNGGVICQPDDVPVESASLLMFYAAYTHSDKCMMTGAGDRNQMEALFEMAKAAFGSKEELIAHPRLLTIVNTNTQMQLDINMTETLMTFAEYGQPFVVASAAMAGSTAPVTLAATIALTNAEVLCAIALAQMVRPGTPVLYASQSTTSDMRNGAIAIGSPEGALCYKYCARLAKFYGLPCRGGGALSDAKIMNTQAGYESMITYMACCQNKINFIIHSAGILDGYTCMSYEKLIADFQIIDYVNRYLRDIEVNDETIPVDLIDEIGHSGQYLTEEHTFEFCRKEPLTPFLSVRGNVEHPEDQFERNVESMLKKSWETYQKPETDAEVLKKMREVLMSRGIKKELLDSIEQA